MRKRISDQVAQANALTMLQGIDSGDAQTQKYISMAIRRLEMLAEAAKKERKQ